jgi:hypothetical protein
MQKLSSYSSKLTGQFVWPAWGNFGNFPDEGESPSKQMISVCFSGADADFDVNKGEAWGSVENCLVGGGAYNQMKEKTPNAKYWYAFGGGNPQPNEWFTNDILNNLPSMDKIKEAGYSGIFFDIEVIHDTTDFTDVFSTVKGAGLEVAVSTSHTAMYNPTNNNACNDNTLKYYQQKCKTDNVGCGSEQDNTDKDCGSLLDYPAGTNANWSQIIQDTNVDYILPQFYGNGTDAYPVESDGSDFSVEKLIETAHDGAKFMPLLKVNISQSGGSWSDNIATSIKTMDDACSSGSYSGIASWGADAAKMCADGYMIYQGN